MDNEGKGGRESLMGEVRPANTRAGLNEAGRLIQAGNLAGAHSELMRLVSHSDAANYLDRFVKFSLKLQKPDVIEALLSDGLPRAERVTMLFQLIELYQRLNDRSSAFRKAMDLTPICADSPDNLHRVAACFVSLGEFRFALEIRERLLRAAPHDYLLALDVVEAKAQIPTNKKRSRAVLDKVRFELTTIMKAPNLPPTAWERAARLYEELDDLDAALQATRKVVESGDSGAAARERLARLLVRKNMLREARHELAILLVERAKEPNRLRALGDLALTLPDRPLAMKFAEAQFECEPTNPECILYLARQLRMDGDLIRAQHLLSSLFHAERESPSISDRQWVRLAQELHDVGDTSHTQEAIAEALKREPHNKVLRNLSLTTALLEKIGAGRASSNHIPGPTAPSLVSRLVTIFRK
jgi:tetratricopeptide (TPR) repeat protein